MKILLTLDSGYEKELSITIAWDMIQDDYAALLSQYSKLPIKGFRPGKSPIGLIESNFARQIKDDLLASVSTRICRKALKEMNMIAGTPIEISDSILQKNICLQFKASFIEMPVFELPDYAKLDLQADNKSDKLDEISLKLIERTNISMHPCFVENELKYSEGIDSEEIEKSNAEARVKLMLILKKIASQDQIEIDEKDIEDRIKLVAAENDVSPEYLRKFLVENRGYARFADSLLAETVFDYIIEIQNS